MICTCSFSNVVLDIVVVESSAFEIWMRDNCD